MQWSDFVRRLSTEVDWTDANYVGRQSGIVEDILHAAQRGAAFLRERTEEIVSDDELFATLAPYMNYPRTLMDKFVIYVDPNDQFRVRLHRFWPRRTSGNAIEKVHYHKWDMSTVLLTGSYEERRFQVTECDETRRRAVVQQLTAATFKAGDTNSLPLRVPHQIINHSMDEPCITLFVRGPSRQNAARTFDTEAGTFYDTYSPMPQLKEGLLQMGRLNGVFHPVLAARTET